MNPEKPNGEILLKLPQVIEKVCYQKTTLYKKIQEKEFPAPVRLGARAVAWKLSEIEAWIESRASTCGVA
jgi:prophage regulatory protein